MVIVPEWDNAAARQMPQDTATHYTRKKQYLQGEPRFLVNIHKKRIFLSKNAG